VRLGTWDLGHEIEYSKACLMLKEINLKEMRYMVLEIYIYIYIYYAF
jgi:hypothetical protein